MGATHRTLRRIELALAMAGAGCVVWVAAWWAVPARYQSRMTGELNRAQAIEIVSGYTVLPAPEAMLSQEAAAADSEDTGPLGVLEIPRLAVSVAVLRGEDDRTLALGAGHLADTALPWEGGNTARAGHRDTHFRPLACAGAEADA